MWVCLTKDYLNDLIFEFEIDEAIQKCFDAAEEDIEFVKVFTS